MKLDVYLKIINEKIVCICLQDSKGCKDLYCQKDKVEYDQYQNIKECIENKGNKNYKNVK